MGSFPQDGPERLLDPLKRPLGACLTLLTSMPIENAIQIADLNPNYPLGTDPVATADDHIRLIKQVLKTAFGTTTVDSLNARSVPSGLIAMWSGAANAIPTGWSLCDGTNNAPDLRDRFIIGAGLGYTVGAKGGNIAPTTSTNGAHNHSVNAAGSHTHTGTVAAHILTVDEIPRHQHEGAWGESKPEYAPFGIAGTGTNPGSGQTDQDNFHFNTGFTGGGQGHGHGLTIDPAADHTHTTNAAGDHAHTVDVRPPYYALCFIMKG